MVWPSITRGIWSYIISRLGIFTDVNSTQLELSTTALKSNNVSVDPSKVSTQDICINDFIIGSLILELNSSGVSINASEININASLESISSPELAISMFLESTRDNLDQLESELPVNEDEKGSKNPSTMTSRLADMILAQISILASNVTFNSTITDAKEIAITIGEIIIPTKNRIEIESVTINTNTTGTEEDFMSKSVFSEDHPIFATNGGPELATINRMVFTYDLNLLNFDADIDYVRADGLECLELLILCLNEIIFKARRPLNGSDLSKNKPTNNDDNNQWRSGDFRFFVERIDILDSWDTTSQALTLAKILVTSGEIKINELSIPEILHVTPFVTIRFSSLLELTWEVPLSVNIPLDYLASAKYLFGRVKDSSSSLNPPEDPEPEPMNIFLPELRICVEDALTVHVFPHRVTEVGVNIREIVLTAGDGQVLISDIYLSFLDGLVVDKIRAHITDEFLNQLDLIKDTLSDSKILSRKANYGESSLDIDTDSINREPECSLSIIPNINMNIRSVFIKGIDQFNIKGALNMQKSPYELTFNCHSAGHYKYVSGTLEIDARSIDDMRGLNANVHFRELDLDINQFSRDRTKGATYQTDTRFCNVTTGLPHLNVGVSFDNALIKVGTHNSLAKLGQSTLGFDGVNVISCTVPSLYVDMEDPSLPRTYVPVLKIAEAVIDIKDTSTSIKIDSLALGCCADTFASLIRLSETLTPSASSHDYKVEMESTVNIFDDILESAFISNNFSRQPHLIRKRTSAKLDIKDDYSKELNRTSVKNITEPSQEELSDKNNDYSVKVDIIRGQFQLFDGFDFDNSRKVMQETVKRVSRAAEMLRKDEYRVNQEDDKDDDEKAIVGDFMYQSMIIVAMPMNVKNLRDKVARESGSPADFARSMEPKIVLSSRRVQAVQHISLDNPNAHFSLKIKDGKVSDLVNTSKFKHLLSSEGNSSRSGLHFIQDTVGPKFAPEIRASLSSRPLRISLDQDTLEFLNRYFQFSSEDDPGSERYEGEETASSIGRSDFIQRFEFGGVSLTIDYNPRKLDYRSSRSGTASELLNIFAVKGAKLTLPANVLHGVNGWDRLFEELMELWLPDIRANQLTGLISGVSPVRKAIKVGKGVGQYTMKPLKKTKISRGASVVVRKTIEELSRVGSSWLDSADNNAAEG